MSTSPLSRSGFAAGTVVRAKECLVPIEQIKVGDWVLSKDECGNSNQAYKRVTNTTHSENVLIGLIRYFSGSKIEQLFVTGDHHFHIRDGGWKQAAGAVHPLELEAYDGAPIGAWDWRSLWCTSVDGIAIAPHSDSGFGEAIDFRNGVGNVISERAIVDMPYCFYCCSVYSIEVEEYHTYYVGKLGVWVHDPQPFRYK